MLLLMQGGGGGGGVTLVETPVLQEIRSRLDVTEGLRPPTPSHTTTLRVKSEQGEQVYMYYSFNMQLLTTMLATFTICYTPHLHDAHKNRRLE